MDIIEFGDYVYMIKEEWKPIIFRGIRTNYEVSNTGLVRNKLTGRMLTQSTDRDGYLHATICLNGKLYHPGVHRYVAEAFIPNPENKPQVNHINGVKTINIVNNLEWVTAQENVIHSFKTGLKTGVKGEQNSLSVYKEKDIRKVCELLEKGISNKKISEITGIPRKYITDIKHHRRWNHISKHYKFKSKEFSKETLSQIKELSLAGYTAWQICNKLHIKRQYTVKKLIEKFRLENQILASTTIENNLDDIEEYIVFKNEL